jgi:acyl transferase domain-containing protein/acyl carrier protein
MGRELAEVSPVFAGRLAECAEALRPYVDWELDDVLAGRHGFEAADVVQPALWAVMVSLAAVWQAAGVVPDAVVGHSQGEIAAAAVSGILSLDDAAKVVALRSRTLTALAGRGGMLSVAEPVEAVRRRIASFGERLSVAAVNGPAATVVSGDADALRELVDSYPESVRTRMIPVDYASHSVQVEALRDEILSALDGIAPGEARIPMVSALTGEWLAGPELDPQYWYASLRETVEFDRAVRVLDEAGHGVFVEVSPHPVLTPALTSPVVVGTLRRDEGGARRLLASFAEAYVRGLSVDWAAVLGRGTAVDLPTYAFQRRHYWPDTDDQRSEETSVTGAEADFWSAVERGDAETLAELLGVDPTDDTLEALTGWRRRERADSTVADWRYRVTWVPVTESGTALSGTWLVVGDGPDAPAVTEALTGHGAEVVRTTLEGLGDQTTDVAGVVSLLALDGALRPEHPAVSVALDSTVALIAALGRAGITAPLWVLTRGAVETGPGEAITGAPQAQVWGLGVVAGLELPDQWGGLVDLPPVLDARAGARLASVLADGGEDQVAVRSRGILARRLRRAGLPAARQEWRPQGTVLITGGTSGVGAITARWTAERRAARAVLTSRSGPSAPAVADLAASIAGLGTAVEVVACDVAEHGAVSALLTRIDTTGPALSSVVHAAGSGGRKPVEQLETADLSALLSAKVGGAAVLDELTSGRDLDAFVLYSSGAGVWGSGGLGGYAAANAYLDALCDSRRARGLVASSVAWGLWAGVGMAASSGGERLREFGMEGIDAERGMRALGQVLDAGEGAVVVAGFDWPRFVPTYTLRRPSRLLADLPEARETLTADTATESTTDGGELAERLTGLSTGDQRQMLTELVRGHAAAVLGYESAEDVLPQRAFKDLGFDSAGAVELRNRLTGAASVPLPSTMIFDYPNAAALAEYLRGELVGSAGAAGDGSGDPVLDDLDRLAAALETVDGGADTRQDITERMQTMLSRWLRRSSSKGPAAEATHPINGRQTVAGQLDEASADEVLDFINKELGAS